MTTQKINLYDGFSHAKQKNVNCLIKMFKIRLNSPEKRFQTNGIKMKKKIKNTVVR